MKWNRFSTLAFAGMLAIGSVNAEPEKSAEWLQQVEGGNISALQEGTQKNIDNILSKSYSFEDVLKTTASFHDVILTQKKYLGKEIPQDIFVNMEKPLNVTWEETSEFALRYATDLTIALYLQGSISLEDIQVLELSTADFKVSA